MAGRWTVLHTCWEGYIEKPDFGHRDRRLHVALLPKPFAGHLDTASVVVLMLNPGMKPVDYFAEFKVPAYRSALLSNLTGSRFDATYPNVFLDPEFSWHSGFDYWYGKFRRLIRQHSSASGRRLSESLQVFSREIAFLELYPYDSESFALPESLSSRLRSARLALSYAHDVLLPRAREGRALIVVTRQSRAWRLSEGRGVVVYSSGEARGAHLTPGSRGGKAILDYLPGS